MTARKKYYPKQLKTFQQFLRRTMYGGKDADSESLPMVQKRQNILDEVKANKALKISRSSNEEF